MSIEADLILAQWLSPAYPVGAFSYSHGLEQVVADGAARDAGSFSQWLSDILEHGGGHSDAILLACAYRAEADQVEEIDATARALAPSSERQLETTQQGAAFAATTEAVFGPELGHLTYPVALGRAARLQGLPLEKTIAFYLHAFASNLSSAAIRLVPLGQTEGQKVLHALLPLCQSIAGSAQHMTLDDIGSSVFAADIASMRHESLYSRLFRS
ncbi:urease accessory protein UreF [Shimia biformata]|uniref:urease accessory protein UreF n=1 Tax=Shimia biformata TaxID=1294299 RepID=UPI00194ED110|nr:urease accessory protein UreF [Shimia biformata]